MCGRYYVDDDTAREIEKIVQKIDRRNRYKGDICPSQNALVITGGTSALKAEDMIWGFPQSSSSRLLINARAETVLDRKTFHDSVLFRRCIIPARGFYEWSRDRSKASFMDPNGTTLYMAGFYNIFGKQNHFIIITTMANSAVLPVHDRMPLILEQSELEDWILNARSLESFLKKTPAMLDRHQDYEQQVLHL